MPAATLVRRRSLPAEPRDYTVGLEEGVRGLKLGLSLDFGHVKADPEVRALVAAAAKRFEELGAVVAILPNPRTPGEPWGVTQIRAAEPTGDDKRDVLIGFVRKLAQSSGTVRDEDFAAIKAAGYSDAQLVEISLAFATTVFTNVFNRINDTEIDFPAIA